MSSAKRSPGQPFGQIPAEVWNGMVDAGDAYRASRLSGGGGPRYAARPTDVIKVRNDTGANRTAGEVVRINGTPLTTITAEHPWVKGVAVTAGAPFGILLKNIEHDGSDPKYGPLQVSGACMATVDIQSTSDRFADIEAASYVLKSGPSGPLEILYAPASTGEQSCLVVFRGGGISRVRGVATADVAAGAAITIGTLVGLDGDASSLGATLSVANTHDWAVNKDAIVRAEYNQTDDVWEAYQVDCYEA